MTSIGFVLTLVFIVLKAFELASITWLQAMLPLLIGIGVDVLMYVIFVIVATIFGSKF